MEISSLLLLLPHVFLLIRCESSPWTAAPSRTIRLLWHGALQWLQGGYLLWCVQIGMPAPSLPSLTVVFAGFSHTFFFPLTPYSASCALVSYWLLPTATHDGFIEQNPSVMSGLVCTMKIDNYFFLGHVLVIREESLAAINRILM